jgi:hypothetical protein
MPDFLLHEGATLMCSHGGQAQPSVPSPRVKVNRQAIIIQSDTYTVVGCTNTNSPCTTASWTSASTRIKSNGVPVILIDSQSLSLPLNTPLSIIIAQARVKGM